MAMLMLENGADLRFIQAMLGHADLTTTTFHTRVAIGKLEDLYARPRPTGTLRRAREIGEAGTAASESAEAQNRSSARERSTMTTATAKQEVEQLLQQLPDNATLEDIQSHVYVLEKIKRGRADIAAGRSHTSEQARARLSRWLDH